MFLARWLFAGEFACSGGPGGIKDVLYEHFRVADPFEWVTGAGSDTSRCCALPVDALGWPETIQRSYRHGRGLGIQHGGGIERRGRSHVEPARGGCLCQACPGWMGSRQVLCGPRGGTCCLVPLFPKCSAIPLGCLSLLVFAKHRLHCLHHSCFCRFPGTAQLFLLCFSGYKLIFKKELELEPESHLFFLHDLVEKLHYGVQQLSPVVLSPLPPYYKCLPRDPGQCSTAGLCF